MPPNALVSAHSLREWVAHTHTHTFRRHTGYHMTFRCVRSQRSSQSVRLPIISTKNDNVECRRNCSGRGGCGQTAAASVLLLVVGRLSLGSIEPECLHRTPRAVYNRNREDARRGAAYCYAAIRFFCFSRASVSCRRERVFGL